MEPSNLEGWVHLIGDGGLPIVLGWLALNVSRIVSRWTKHLDRVEDGLKAEESHRKATRDHMDTEERYLRRIASASEARPQPAPTGQPVTSGAALIP